MWFQRRLTLPFSISNSCDNQLPIRPYSPTLNKVENFKISTKLMLATLIKLPQSIIMLHTLLLLTWHLVWKVFSHYTFSSSWICTIRALLPAKKPSISPIFNITRILEWWHGLIIRSPSKSSLYFLGIQTFDIFIYRILRIKCTLVLFTSTLLSLEPLALGLKLGFSSMLLKFRVSVLKNNLNSTKFR